MKYSVIFISFFTLCILSCGKHKDCPKEFQLLAQVTPYKEAYSVGDTLLIKSKIHKNLYEVNTKRTYDMETVELAPSLRVLRIDKDSFTNTSATKEHFDFVNNTGYDIEWFVFSGGSSMLDCKYNFQNDTFDLQIQLIAKSVGIYYMRYGSNLYQSHQEFPGKCKREFFDVVTVMNEGKDGNIHLFNDSPDPHFNTWVLQKPQARFYDTGGFCFRVVD